MVRFASALAGSLLPLSMAWGAATLVDGAGSGNGGKDPGPALERPTPKLPRCEIRVDELDGSVVLEGLVFTRKPISGSYELEVSQEGGAGSSDILQSGDFRAKSGEPASLGVVSLGDRMDFIAKLRVRWQDGALDCQAVPRKQPRHVDAK